MVTSEALPFAKTGGLADVAGALPLALGRLGHQVTLALPRYRSVPISGALIAQFPVTLRDRAFAVAIYEQTLGTNARALLVDCPPLYDRDGIYGAATDFDDNPLRFGVLARAVFDFALSTKLHADVVHAHDWPGGPVPVYLKTRYARSALAKAATVFTIHNISYQGLFDRAWLARLELPGDLFSATGLEYWGRISLLKGGINFSDRLTTVSRRHAEEILTPELGFGFEGVLDRRRQDLVGILNGIDAERWNPKTDPDIPKPYDATDLSGKSDAKAALLATFGWPNDASSLAVPLVGMIARMVDQKGLDLIQAVADDLPKLGARFVVLGTGEPRYESMWRELARRYPQQIAARIGFDEALAHLIEAGADLFLMPSRFEPCGLNQMYSLRYGTLPIVRATGGLDDTVVNYDPATSEGNGFKFSEYTPAALLSILTWALSVYKRRDVWKVLQRRGMAQNFSWDASARKYVRVYGEAVAARASA